MQIPEQAYAHYQARAKRTVVLDGRLAMTCNHTDPTSNTEMGGVVAQSPGYEPDSGER